MPLKGHAMFSKPRCRAFEGGGEWAAERRAVWGDVKARSKDSGLFAWGCGPPVERHQNNACLWGR